ncbi:AAA family ATPase [Actinomycetes bacterium KLBMP 9759]
MLRGRVEERAALEKLLQRARDGAGGAAVITGEPGIGKTALLTHAAAEAEGMCVLRTVGAEPESELGYAALHQLLLPQLDRASSLPAPQAGALAIVFGAAEGAPPDRFMVALATLTLLTDLAAEQPVVCLVDDAQWLDRPSLDVLMFVVRRIALEPIAVVLAARPDATQVIDLAGAVDIRLGGLDRLSARELLLERTGDQLSVPQQDEVIAAAAGNPLAIRELPIGGWRVGEPLPLTESLGSAFRERVRRLDPPSNDLLLLVAADGTGRLDVVQAAAGRDGHPLDGLDELVEVDGGRVAFRHPLIRSAVYHGADPARRRAAHQALAVAHQDPERRAWHLGQAADGPDEDVAAELERSATRAMRRAGPAAAAAALTRAAELSADDDRRQARLVDAAAAWWRGGDAVRAQELLARARIDVDGPTRYRAAGLRALVELRAGRPSDAVTLLRPVLAGALESDRDAATELLMLLGEASFHANTGSAWAEVVDTVGRRRLGKDDHLFRLVTAVAQVRSGAPVELLAADLDAVERMTDPEALCWAGGLLYGLGRREHGRWLRREAMRHARATGAVGTLAWVLMFVVSDEQLRDRLDTAAAHAEEGQRFAMESGQPNLDCWFRGSLAVMASIRDSADEAVRLASSVLAEAQERDLAAAAGLARRALGIVELAAGRHDEALQHLRPPERAGDAHPGIILMNVPELVEAAVRAQRPEQAAEPLEQFARWARASGSPELGALAARSRALTTEGDAAYAEYRNALDLHEQADHPLEKARTELLYGQFLRRERRRSDARTVLRSALATFGRLDAKAWTARAADELRATGESGSAGQQSDALGTLTPQELRIATAVSEGATNREIAAQLFLSVRTIDYHLRKVFQKLHITSRAELVRFVLAEGKPNP